MVRRDAAKDLCEQVRTQLQTQHTFTARLERERRQFFARKARVAERFQQKLLRRVLGTAGVEYDEILKRQATDHTSSERFLQQQKRTWAAQCKAVTKRHNAAIGYQLKAGARIPPPAPPPLKLRVDEALTWDAVKVHTNTQAAELQVSLAPGQNVLTGYVLANPESGYGNCAVNVVLHFLWNSDRDGTLTASTQVWPNLRRNAYLRPSCSGNPFGQTGLALEFYVTQVDLKGQIHSLDMGSINLEAELSGSDSSGSSSGDILQDPLVLTNNQSFPIVNGKPVVLTVVVRLTTQADGGWAEFDFEERWDARINVPFVELIAM